MGQISDDNCCTYIEHIASYKEFPKIRIRFDGYGFTLDYEGSEDEFWEEFESMFKTFVKDVLESYEEFKNFNLDSRYESCFNTMIEDFETHDCAFTAKKGV